MKKVNQLYFDRWEVIFRMKESGKTYAEIGALYGISRQAVGAILQRRKRRIEKQNKKA